MTVKLYDESAYIFEFTATVLSCEKTENGCFVTLDKTAFFPNEGGQECDKGMLGDATVLDVNLDGDTVIHTVDREIFGTVLGKIEKAERLDKMQQHTAEHMACGVIYEKFGYDNVGFHLGADVTTFDVNGKLSHADIVEIERAVNEKITENRSVKCYYPEDVSKLNYRSKKELDGSIRIVEIDGVDTCACCAPHVAVTGEIGVFKIIDHIAYKGGTRMTFVAGKRATEYFNNLQDSAKTVASALSVPVTELANGFEKFTADTQKIKATLSELKKKVIALECDKISNTDGNIVLFWEDGQENARECANLLVKKCRTVGIFVKNQDGYTLTVASETENMQALADTLRQNGAKCGGSKEMISGSIRATKEQIEELLR